MSAELDIWILLFIAAAAQGFFLFFLLIANQQKKQNHNGYLAALILLFTLTISYYITFWTGVSNSLPLELRVIMYFTFLFGPLLIGYISKVKTGKLPDSWRWHFVPAAIVLLGFVLLSVGLVPLTPEQSTNLGTIIVVSQNVHLLLYSIWAIRMGSSIKSTQWGRNIAIAFTGYSVCFMAYYIMTWTGTLQLQYDYMVSLGMSAFVYFIGYHGFRSPEALYRKAFSLKYEKSSLTEQALLAVEGKLDELMVNQKLFTKGDLKLQDLADILGLSANDISQTVNVKKQMKFTDYLNELRVAEAEQLMHSEEYKDLKLLAVAIDSGFNNKTSFLNAFKKKHGISPSEYRKQIHLKAS